MKIKLNDNDTVFFVTLLIEFNKETKNELIKNKTYDIFQKIQKTAKSVPEAINETEREAITRPGFIRVVAKNCAILTPKIFFNLNNINE